VGYSSLLLSPDHSWESTEQQNFLYQIHQKGQYIESLINSMNLSFRLEDNAHPMPLQIHNFDLVPFMENLMADMLNQEPDKIFVLSLESIDAHLDIEADDKLLYRAIANLIGNAMQHNPAGTNIKIKIKRSGQGVDILVCDNGVGMSQETIGTLFEKYHDNQNPQNGKIDYASGLGLSIVKSIVDAHHGELLIYSKENAETVFTIHIPTEQTEEKK
jgi:signal transduction histidine kinase